MIKLITKDFRDGSDIVHVFPNGARGNLTVTHGISYDRNSYAMGVTMYGDRRQGPDTLSLEFGIAEGCNIKEYKKKATEIKRLIFTEPLYLLEGDLRLPIIYGGKGVEELSEAMFYANAKLVFDMVVLGPWESLREVTQEIALVEGDNLAISITNEGNLRNSPIIEIYGEGVTEIVITQVKSIFPELVREFVWEKAAGLPGSDTPLTIDTYLGKVYILGTNEADNVRSGSAMPSMADNAMNFDISLVGGTGRMVIKYHPKFY